MKYTLDEYLKLEESYENVVRDSIGSYSEFTKFIRMSLDRAIKLAEAANMVKSDSWENLHEDQISQHFVTFFLSRGVKASHDSFNRGHPDICIEHATYKWIVEAKKDNSNSYLMDGYEQLTTRYTTGAEGESTGCLLIYCIRPKVAQNLSSWMDYLEARKNIKSKDKLNSLEFHTVEQHSVSGTDFTTWHIPVSFYLNPLK